MSQVRFSVMTVILGMMVAILQGIDSHSTTNSQDEDITEIHPPPGQIQFIGDAKYIREILLHLFGEEDSKWMNLIKPPGQVLVNISMSLRRIIRLDERTQKLTVKMWKEIHFENDLLSWNLTHYNNIETIRISRENIWVPGIILYNSIDDSYKELLPETIAVVSHKGYISVVEPIIVSTVCELNLVDYPFDSHRCDFVFGSWSNALQQVKLVGDEANTGYYVSNSIWRLLEFSAVGGVQKFHDNVPYSIVTYTMVFDRRWMLPFIYLVIPNLLINLTCVFGFLLPSESYEKVGVAITLFLSLIVYLLLFYQSLPLTENMPVLVEYVICTIFGVTFSVIMNIVILYFHYGGSTDNGKQLPPWARDIFLKKIGAWIGLGSQIVPDEEHFEKMEAIVDQLEVIPDIDDEIIGDKSQKKYLSVVSGHSEKQSLNNKNSNANGEEADETVDELILEQHKMQCVKKKSIWFAPKVKVSNEGPVPEKKETCRRRTTVTMRRSEVRNNVDVLLYRVLKHCEEFKEHLVLDQRNEEIKLEWKQLALVLDRIMFIFYLLFTICTWIYLVSRIPVTRKSEVE